MDDPAACDLTKPFEFYGRWWRSGTDSEQSVQGCISYTPQFGLQLQLYEDFPDDRPVGPHMFFGEDKSDVPIWGELSLRAGRRVPVSLFGNINTNEPVDPSSKAKPPSHEIFHINQAVVGVHALNTDDLVCRSLYMSVVDLEEFVGLSPLHPADVGGDLHSHGVVYRPIKPINCTIETAQIDISITSQGGYESSRDDRRHIVNYQFSIEIKPPVPVKHEAGMDIVTSLTRFFALCLRESVNRRFIQAILESGEVVAFYGKQIAKLNRPKHRDWLFKLKDIGADNLGAVLSRWFALIEQLGFTAPVFFSELSAPSRINDARFLHFAGCLEAFHRECVRPDIGKFMPKADFKKIANNLVSQIPQNVPEGLAAAVKSALSRANDKAFGERLDELFRGLELGTQKMLALEPERFLAAVKHSRNRLAHVTDGDDREIFEGLQYAHANLSIRGWLRILMLRACGLSEELIRARMEAINYFYWGPFSFESPAQHQSGW